MLSCNVIVGSTINNEF